MHGDVHPARRRFVYRRRIDLFDGVARVAQEIRRSLQRSVDIRMHWIAVALVRERDLDRSRLRCTVERYRDPPRITRIRARHGPRCQRHVADFPADRTLHRHQLGKQPALRRCRRVVRGHTAEGRLDRGHAAVKRGKAQRAADVVAVMDGTEARRRRRAGAARRSARRRLGVPRVSRSAMQRTVRRRPHRQLRRVGPSDHDRPGVAQVAHHRRILRRDHGFQRRQAVGRGRALHVDVFFDRHRYPVQRTELTALRHLLVCRGRCAQRLLAVVVNDRIELRVQRLHARQHGLHYRFTGKPLRADTVGELTGAQAPRFSHELSSSYCVQRSASSRRLSTCCMVQPHSVVDTGLYVAAPSGRQPC